MAFYTHWLRLKVVGKKKQAKQTGGQTDIKQLSN